MNYGKLKSHIYATQMDALLNGKHNMMILISAQLLYNICSSVKRHQSTAPGFNASAPVCFLFGTKRQY